MKCDVKMKSLHPDFRLPEQATLYSAGVDLVYCGDKEVILSVGGAYQFPVGFSMELPAGFEAQIRSRSGLAKKYGITVLNSPGTVDADYRGPVSVLLVKSARVLHYHEKEVPTWDNFPKHTIKPGDRIAQMVISRVPDVTITQVVELSNTDRGQGGFGSTGT